MPDSEEDGAAAMSASILNGEVAGGVEKSAFLDVREKNKICKKCHKFARKF